MKLPRSFYLRPTLAVAKDLLGKIIVRTMGTRHLHGRIVEVEAYCGTIDPASHSYRGMTDRNAVMFGKGGFLYVYFTYGMHFCANVVTRPEGIGEAVLIRAVEPLNHIDVLKKHRFPDARDVNRTLLTNGPAKFAQAFGLTRKDSGIDLCGSEIYLLDRMNIPSSNVITTKRIGISSAKDKRWRYYIKGNEWVSKK